MKELLEKLIKQHEDKSKERDAILAKGDAIEVTDLETVKGINEGLLVLQKQIKDAQDVTKSTEATKDFVGNPVIDLPMRGSGAVQVLSALDSGDQVEFGVDAKGRLVAENKGRHGLIDQKVYDAIRAKDYEDAFEMYVRSAGDLARMPLTSVKTLQEGTDSAGGFLVPEQWLNRMIMKTAAPTRVNGRVTQFTISGDSVMIPKVNYSTDNIYTTGIRVTLTGERPTSSTVHRVTDPVFGQTRLDIGTYMMSMPLTNDLVEDANFPIKEWCSERFRETIDLLYDDQLLNGTGVGVRPHGIFRNPNGTDEPARYLSNTANNIDAVQLRKTPFQVPEQYINDNTCWIANRSSFGATVASMVDSEGRFMFMNGQTYPGLVGRNPDQLCGYPIVYSAFCADIGDGAYPAVFGDPKGVAKVNRIGFSIRVLTERYAEDNYVVLLGRLRWGGGLIEPFRMVIVKSDNA